MSIEAVSLKLPTFWTKCPAAWFAQSEAQFNLRGITGDDTKYYHVVAALDATTAARALPVLSSPPVIGSRYDTIKAYLTDAFGISESERAAAILNTKDLGDHKPSEAMDEMLALLGEHKPCFLFKHVFLRMLPETIRSALANSTQTDYRELAKEADNLYHALQKTSIYLIQQDQNNEIDTICWFHKRFGSNARKCSTTCQHNKAFTQKSKKSRQENSRVGQQ